MNLQRDPVVDALAAFNIDPVLPFTYARLTDQQVCVGGGAEQ